jgi:hypothetical protein
VVDCQVDEQYAKFQEDKMRRHPLALLLVAIVVNHVAGFALFAEESPGKGPAFLFQPAPKITTEEAVARSKRIMFPELRTGKISASEAIFQIRAKAMDISRGKPDVEITMTAGVAFPPEKTEIELEMKNASLHAVLEEVAKQARLVLSFDDGSAAFWTKEEIADKKAVLTEAQKAQLKRAEEIVIPNFEVKDLMLPEVIKLLNAQAKASDPEKRGVLIELSHAAAAAKTKLTISLEGKSVSDALNLIINLANLRRKMVDSKVVLAALGEG